VNQVFQASFRLISIPDGKDSPRGFIQTNLHPGWKGLPKRPSPLYYSSIRIALKGVG